MPRAHPSSVVGHQYTGTHEGVIRQPACHSQSAGTRENSEVCGPRVPIPGHTRPASARTVSASGRGRRRTPPRWPGPRRQARLRPARGIVQQARRPPSAGRGYRRRPLRTRTPSRTTRPASSSTGARMPIGLPIAAARRHASSMTPRTSGCRGSPRKPRLAERSDGPMKTPSTPSTAAFCSSASTEARVLELHEHAHLGVGLAEVVLHPPEPVGAVGGGDTADARPAGSGPRRRPERPRRRTAHTAPAASAHRRLAAA